MKATTAQMERKRKGQIPWLVIGAVAVGAWFLLKKPATMARGIGGAIQGMAIDGVPMGAHKVLKNAGDPITVTITWKATTTNVAGTLISWNYRLSTWVLNAAGSIVAGPVTALETRPGNLALPVTTTLALTMPNGQSGALSVLAKLEGAVSDAVGNPGAGFVSLFDATHADAIFVGGPATPSGSITGTIGVAQNRW